MITIDVEAFVQSQNKSRFGVAEKKTVSQPIDVRISRFNSRQAELVGLRRELKLLLSAIGKLKKIEEIRSKKDHQKNMDNFTQEWVNELADLVLNGNLYESGIALENIQFWKGLKFINNSFENITTVRQKTKHRLIKLAKVMNHRYGGAIDTTNISTCMRQLFSQAKSLEQAKIHILAHKNRQPFDQEFITAVKSQHSIVTQELTSIFRSIMRESFRIPPSKQCNTILTYLQNKQMQIESELRPKERFQDVMLRMLNKAGYDLDDNDLLVKTKKTP